MKPVLTETAMDTLREFLVHHVSGRGQYRPYGSVISLMASCSPAISIDGNGTSVRFPPGTPFLNTLYKALAHYNDVWKSLLDQLMYTGKPGIDPSDVLMNILGLQSNSVSFFQRNAFSTEQLFNKAEFEYGGKYFNDLISSFVSKGELLDFLKNSFGFVPPTVNGEGGHPPIISAGVSTLSHESEFFQRSRRISSFRNYGLTQLCKR